MGLLSQGFTTIELNKVNQSVQCSGTTKADYERYKTDIKGDLNKYYKSAFEIDQSAFKNKN